MAVDSPFDDFFLLSIDNLSVSVSPTLVSSIPSLINISASQSMTIPQSTPIHTFSSLLPLPILFLFIIKTLACISVLKFVSLQLLSHVPPPLSFFATKALARNSMSNLASPGPLSHALGPSKRWYDFSTDLGGTMY
jgi:hypothetical protein